MDTSFGTSCCSMFLDQRRLMDQLGRRIEGEEHKAQSRRNPLSPLTVLAAILILISNESGS